MFDGADGQPFSRQPNRRRHIEPLRPRHAELFAGELDLEDDVAHVVESIFSRGQIILEHAAEPLVEQRRHLVAVALKAGVPGEQGLGIVPAQDLQVGDALISGTATLRDRTRFYRLSYNYTFFEDDRSQIFGVFGIMVLSLMIPLSVGRNAATFRSSVRNAIWSKAMVNPNT